MISSKLRLSVGKCLRAKTSREGKSKKRKKDHFIFIFSLSLFSLHYKTLCIFLLFSCSYVDCMLTDFCLFKLWKNFSLSFSTFQLLSLALSSGSFLLLLFGSSFLDFLSSSPSSSSLNLSEIDLLNTWVTP